MTKREQIKTLLEVLPEEIVSFGYMHRFWWDRGGKLREAIFQGDRDPTVARFLMDSGHKKEVDRNGFVVYYYYLKDATIRIIMG